MQSNNAGRTPVTTSVTALAASGACSGRFVAHTLDHTTTVRDDLIHLFESNGAGVAVNDLNNDGLLDLLFANLDGPNAILWNRGNLTFEREPLDDRDARAVTTVDVDGDGLLDILFTHRLGGVSYWRNQDGLHFVRSMLQGVYRPAYSMTWADFDQDGRLDLVTGSYDTELAKERPNDFLWSDGAGVVVYQQGAQGFVAQRLSPTAQALALGVVDVNRDGQADLLVGNDFAIRDQTWVRSGNDWVAGQPFATTAESTMSLDWGDIDNNGSFDVFASDMQPYAIDVQTLAAWLPMMATMPTTHAPDDPQRMQNVLQIETADGTWREQAVRRGVDATGWGWSSKFGDLDNDGALDLYVVNGMIAAELFKHLPHAELIEANQARRNMGDGYFEPAPQWGLGATSSGRGMSMADLDNDGDLDIVVNNLQSPAQLFENQICNGRALEVDLGWSQGHNTRALGAQLILHTSTGNYLRDVRAVSGYLSGDAARVHFGLPADSVIQSLEVRWPDGGVSQVAAPQPGTRLLIQR